MNKYFTTANKLALFLGILLGSLALTCGSFKESGKCVAYHFTTRYEVRYYEVHCSGTAMPSAIIATDSLALHLTPPDGTTTIRKPPVNDTHR